MTAISQIRCSTASPMRATFRFLAGIVLAFPVDHRKSQFLQMFAFIYYYSV
jgi:hypothetical protein